MVGYGNQLSIAILDTKKLLVLDINVILINEARELDYFYPKLFIGDWKCGVVPITFNQKQKVPAWLVFLDYCLLLHG